MENKENSSSVLTKREQIAAMALHGVLADRAKTAKSELSDVVLTKDMTREERRSAFLAELEK